MITIIIRMWNVKNDDDNDNDNNNNNNNNVFLF